MLVVDGLEFGRTYWTRGHTPKGARVRNAVQDPPCGGWMHVLLMRGEKVSTLFCPFSLTAYTVPNGSAEVAHFEEPKGEWDRDKIVRIMTSNWTEYQGYGWMRDYDTCALVFRKLDAPVPEQTLRGGEEDTRKKGGKEVAKALAKPVKRDGKRGQFLQWFLENGGSRSVREAMAHFSMSRSNALSYLFMLKKDHGIGYELVGDTATVTLPDGCTDPFASPGEQARPPVVEEAVDDEAPDETAEEATDDDDDSWLD